MTFQTYLLILACLILVVVPISMYLSYKTFRKEYEKESKLDISVEQMITSEKRVADFLQQNQLRPGASLQAIAEALNIVDGGINHQISDRAWLSAPDAEGKMRVFFKGEASEEDLRFDFAHECGHLINRDPAPATRPEGFHKPEVEQLADYVGAALLMPLDSVYSFLNEHNYLNVSHQRQTALIRLLCKKYGVSRMNALRRVKEVYVIKQADPSL